MFFFLISFRGIAFFLDRNGFPIEIKIVLNRRFSERKVVKTRKNIRFSATNFADRSVKRINYRTSLVLRNYTN